jgi:hypothetical protein
MANLQSDDVITLGADSFSSSATPLHRIGTRAIDRSGRVYRYVLAGAADLVAGNCIQGPAIVPNHLANTPPVVAVGATSFTYTPGSTLGTVNQYAGGWLQVDTTPGNGQAYQVDNHAAFATGTAFTLNLNTGDPINTALTASSRVGLIQNPYSGVIQMPITTATGSLVGVAVSIITALQYGWILTYGMAPVLIAGTPALGAAVMSPGTVAGAAVVLTTTNLVVAQLVGNMMQVGVDTKNNAVNVTIRA